MLIDIPTRISNIAYDIRCIPALQANNEMCENNGILIDVREPGEVQANPVPKATNFPRGVLEMKMLENIKDASKPIYIHCASGVRAKLSAEQLLTMGYENVTVITCSVPDINKAVND